MSLYVSIENKVIILKGTQFNEPVYIHWHSCIFSVQTEVHLQFLHMNSERNSEKYKKLMDKYTDDFQSVEGKGIRLLESLNYFK